MENENTVNGTEEKKEAGQSYNYSDAELIRQLVRSRMSQKQELEYEDLDGYVLPPRTQFSMLNKPAVTFKYGKMKFNMACIRLFENVQHVLTLIHEQKKRLTIVMCPEEQSGSVEWARRKQSDGTWVNKDISTEQVIYKLYRLMGWKMGNRYKALGRVANSREGLVLVFELEEAVMFASEPMEYVDEKTGEVKKKQVQYFPDIYKDSIGKSYNDYVDARQMNLFEYLEEYQNQTYSDAPEEQKTETEGSAPTETVESVQVDTQEIPPSEGNMVTVRPPVDSGGGYEQFNR